VASTALVDPRQSPTPPLARRAARTTDEPEQLHELQRLCREGRIYAVERWIAAGAPLQLALDTPAHGRRDISPLRIAVEGGQHALLLLLLCNGYDPSLEESSPLDVALRSRRPDLVDLLLTWGADPKGVDPEAVFDTYDLATIERFWSLGTDYTDGYALAHYLGEHTSNKPLFGWVKRHAPAVPEVQRQLDMALGEHVHRGREKGVLLCLWSGANPHVRVPPVRYLAYGLGEEDEDEGSSAVYEACAAGRPELLRRLKPDPAKDDFQELYRGAVSPTVVDALAETGPLPTEASLIPHQVHRATWPWASWASQSTLEALIRHGARWTDEDPGEIASVRRSLLKAPDSLFVDLIRLLALKNAASPGILKELARTPAMRARLKKAGFFPADTDHRGRVSLLRPTRAREVLAALGITIPKPKREPVLWRSVQIGQRRHGDVPLSMTRSELYDHVWRRPISEVAATWGLSGPGLAKACRRVQIPVPPRGYWARVAAGQKLRRPRLPVLPKGQAEEIVVWIPSPQRQ
jgi:ankyrin repeat protein